MLDAPPGERPPEPSVATAEGVVRLLRFGVPLLIGLCVISTFARSLGLPWAFGSLGFCGLLIAVVVVLAAMTQGGFVGPNRRW